MLYSRISGRILLCYRNNCYLFAPQKVFAATSTREGTYFNHFLSTVTKCNISFIHTSSAFKKKVIPIALPDWNDGIAEMQIKKWYVKEGDTVKQFDKICELECDMLTDTLTSSYDGIIHKRHYEVNDVAKVGSPLVDIDIESTEEAGTRSFSLPLVSIYSPESSFAIIKNIRKLLSKTVEVDSGAAYIAMYNCK